MKKFIAPIKFTCLIDLSFVIAVVKNIEKNQVAKLKTSDSRETSKYPKSSICQISLVEKQIGKFQIAISLKNDRKASFCKV